jgi:Kef-type K+ transport system membrane component KefB
MENQAFLDLALIIISVVVLSGVMRFLKQPLIVAYIIAGFLLSPYGFDVVDSQGALLTFSQIGVTFLLFMVGLNMNPRVIKEVGKVSFWGGIGQVLITLVLGVLLARVLGFDNVPALYLGLGMAFSSTIIVVKLISDKGELERLHGRIAVGLLIVQDIIIALLLMGIPSFSGGMPVGELLTQALFKGTGLLLFLGLLTIYVVPRVTKWMASSRELLMLFAISWCLALASLFHVLGFSMEVGALLAGMTLSISPYRYEISSKIKPLRDFFLVLFFVFIGAQMELLHFEKYGLALLAFSLFVLVVKPLIVIGLVGVLGHTKRNSIRVGLSMAQISEFAFILFTLGISQGHLEPEMLSFLVIIGLITIFGSTYMTVYDKKVYKKIHPFFDQFKWNRPSIKSSADEKYDILLIGYSHIGLKLPETLKRMKKKFLVIDYNPDMINQLKKEKIPCRYGDVSDLESLSEIDLKKLKMVISTIRDFDANVLMITRIREQNKKAILILVAHEIDEAMKLYDKGASYVIMPHMLGGHHTSMLIEEHGVNLEKFLAEKVKHIKDLRKL